MITREGVGAVDRFGTAGLRAAVLAAWATSPDRFREDANAEEDVALGGYAGRVVVELAQNAADAAGRAGVPGRLLLRLDDGPSGAVLTAANTGAPLDAAGVRSLASLRASAKRADASVGRFGVGAASVVAVAEQASWVTAAGDGVRFSRRLTAEALAAAGPGLAEEVARREGAVPVLRLPWPLAPGELAVPPGFETAVVLPLRDAAAVAAVRAQLDAAGDALLLALPALAEVVVELPDAPRRVVTDVERRWSVVRRSGAFAPGVLEGLATEERQRAERAGWSLAWALPRASGGAPVAAPVVHAPTPTQEPLPWPALLVATLPLDPSRRLVGHGPATAVVLDAAARAFADALAERAGEGHDVLPLVPTGLAAGWVDGVLRERVLELLPRAPVLLGVGDGAPLRPRDAVRLEGPLADDPGALAALAPLVAGLVAAPRRSGTALRTLGVGELALADLVDALPAPGDPAAWARTAAALAPLAADPPQREQLTALGVPLAGGRTARGARGLLLASADCLPEALAVLAARGLPVVDAAAVADRAAAGLLAALGARTAGARGVLAHPATAAAVREAADDAAGDAADAGDEADDRGADGLPSLSRAVLALAAAALAAGELRAGDLPALAELPLPDTDGELLPAAGLVLPGSPAAALLDDREVGVVAPTVLARWGADVLEAVGVARTLAVLRWADVDPTDPPEDLAALDGAPAWLRAAAAAGGDGAVAAEVVAVRDLDLVRADADAALLTAVVQDPDLATAVITPVRLVTPAGAVVPVRSLPATWLGTALRLAGRAAPGAPPALAALLPRGSPATVELSGALPAPLAAALGMVSTWVDLDDAAWQELLDACARGRRALPAPADLLELWRALAASAPDVDPPEHLAALDASGAVVLAAAGGAVVVDDPRWAQRGDLGARLVPGAALAEALADVLDLDLASERAPGAVDAAGEEAAVPGAVRAVLAGAPATWREHDVLTVDGTEVDWWVEGGAGGRARDAGSSAVVHAATTAGLARALAWAAGAWGRRSLVEAVLTQPGAVTALLVEDAAG